MERMPRPDGQARRFTRAMRDEVNIPQLSISQAVQAMIHATVYTPEGTRRAIEELRREESERR